MATTQVRQAGPDRAYELEQDFLRGKFAMQRLCGPDREHARGYPELEAGVGRWWREYARQNTLSPDRSLAFQTAVFLEQVYLDRLRNSPPASREQPPLAAEVGKLFSENGLRRDNIEHMALMIQAGHLFASREVGLNAVTRLISGADNPNLTITITGLRGTATDVRGRLEELQAVLREKDSPRVESGKSGYVTADVTDYRLPVEYGLDKPESRAVALTYHETKVGIPHAVALEAIAGLENLNQPIATAQEVGARRLAVAAGITDAPLAGRVLRELVSFCERTGLDWTADLDVQHAIGYKSASGGISGAIVPLTRPQGDRFAVSSVRALGNADDIIVQSVTKGVFDEEKARVR